MCLPRSMRISLQNVDFVQFYKKMLMRSTLPILHFFEAPDLAFSLQQIESFVDWE
jgi:hypothetical protein